MAGRQYHLNGDSRRSLPLLERAWNASPPVRDAGWYYADALCATSGPAKDGEVPDRSRVEHVKRVWDQQAERFGPPRGGPGLGLSRPRADLRIGGLRPGRRSGGGLRGALVYAEKALVLNDRDAETWGLCTRLLRGLGMNSAALECANRGFALEPDSRLTLREGGVLADPGQYAEAEETLKRITGGDSDPWAAGLRFAALPSRPL